MLDENFPPSPNRAVVALVPTDPEWQPIFHGSNQVVLYNPTSHALSIRHSSHFPQHLPTSLCPYCKRPLPSDFEADAELDSDHGESLDSDPEFRSRASNYFQLLAIANETSSRPSTPPPIEDGKEERRSSTFPAEAMAEGYFKAFFQEECRLGMGANGTVFLCQHMLDGNPLGHFAVKKIAVGESHSYLLKILREVRLLERLHHPNIVTYHHAWLESCQFSSFGPKVPTLHVLMQWAEGGSLDDFIDARLGRPTNHIHIHPVGPLSSTSNSHLSSTSLPTTPQNLTPTNVDTSELHSRSARIRAHRAFLRASPEERERMKREMQGGVAVGGTRTTWTAVHLLSAEEVKSLFGDVVEGLAFLHDKSILHLDLKPGNVLLTWDEGRLIPRAMLSDFGTSRDMIHSSRTRSGNTGTLEYTSPESLPSPRTGLLQQIDSKADLWSLGMILHKLLFFRLPYRYAADGDANGESAGDLRDSEKMDRLEKEVLEYTGFKSTQALVTAFEARRLPRAFLVLLESLLNVTPPGRPSCERVLTAIREGRLDPLQVDAHRLQTNTSLIPMTRRPPNHDIHVETSNEQVFNAPVTSDEDVDQDLTENEEADPGTPKAGERTPLLGLPAPHDDTTVWERPVVDTPKVWIPRILWMRTIKSSILVAKVLTIASICPESRPYPAVLLFVLFVAVIDTWFDGLWISAAFGLFHVVVLRLGCRNDKCCS